MIEVDKRTRQKIEGAASIIDEFAQLAEQFEKKFLENKNSKSKGFDSKTIHEKAKNIRENAFKIVVCGKFKNGKSTFVNALLERELMAAKATACTAVIAVVKKGSDERNVTVVYNDHSTKKMSLETFTREFQLTDDEQKNIDAAAANGEDIVFDRFANINHVEMQSMHPMFESGCCLIDTPGLEEALSRDTVTTTYLPQADAIVFTMNATGLFSSAERKFISENFAGKHKKNVFFVINRINQIQPGQLENAVIPSVKSGLRVCFTDETGLFDEELFKKRVFYINAYGALCAVTGQEEEIFVSGRWQKFPIDINTTGLPEYAAAQNDFISSDEKNEAMLSEAINLLADQYRGIISDTKSKINAMNMNDSQRKEAARKAKESLDKAEATVKKIEDAFDRFGKVASDAMFLDLMNYFDKNIKGEYAAHVQSDITQEHYKATWQLADAAWNTLAYLPNASIKKKAADNLQKHMKPISDDLDQFIKNKMQVWKTQSGACIKSYADDLNEEIKDLCEQFDGHIETSVAAFSGEKYNQNRTAKGGIQTAIALFLGKDMSAIVDISNSGGSVSWGQLAGKYIGQVMIDSILIALAPQAVLFKFGIDALIIVFKAKSAAQKRAVAIGEAGIDGYKELLKKNELTFKQSIIKNVDNTKKKISKPPMEMVESERAKVEQLASEHQKSAAEEKAIKDNLNTIGNQMHDKIESLYQLTFDRKPTEAEFNKLGKNIK